MTDSKCTSTVCICNVKKFVLGPMRHFYFSNFWDYSAFLIFQWKKRKRTHSQCRHLLPHPYPQQGLLRHPGPAARIVVRGCLSFNSKGRGKRRRRPSGRSPRSGWANIRWKLIKVSVFSCSLQYDVGRESQNCPRNAGYDC